MGVLITAEDNIINQSANTIQCPTSAEDFKLINCFPAHERADQAAEAEDVIEVTMRQQDARQMPEADTGLQNLTLCAFAAVNEKTIFVVRDDKS